MSDKPGGSSDSKKPKDDDDNKQTKLPPNTPSISGSETSSPEASRNVDELRNKEDLTAWLDDVDEERKSEIERRQEQRRTVKPSLYRRRITKPGTDIKKELEELAREMERGGGWQEEPSPLKLDTRAVAVKKPEHGKMMKRIVPLENDRSIPPTRDHSISPARDHSISPARDLDYSTSPTFTPRYGLLFDSSDLLPEISIRMNDNSSLTIRNALIVSIILFCFSLIIMAVSIYKLKFP